MAWLWVLGGLIAWFVAASVLALLLGRVVRMADERSADPAAGVAAAVARAPETAMAAARPRRLQIPLPPFAIGLVAVAVALETVGYVIELTGSTGQLAQLLSMDAFLSLPRMYVAALFGAAAFLAVLGAGTVPGRRTWWTAVGAVTGVVCAIKAGSTIHATAVDELSERVTLAGAVAISATVVIAVVAGLTYLSRTERRDRRRVLSALALYAAASVGLSAVSSALAGAYGTTSSWALAATYVEETGEAIAAVTMLVAVLAGVAPRVVLPAAWALRRTTDDQTLQVPDPSPLATRTSQG